MPTQQKPMSFELKDEVKIYGGFDTSSSGLKRYKDASILEGKLSSDFNSRRILTGTNLSAITVLDGFLIQNGLNTIANAKGCGFYLRNNSKPKLSNLTFKNNILTGSHSYGGAIYNYSSKSNISNSVFSNNKSNGDGVAIYNYNNASVKIYNSILWNNRQGNSPNINNIFNQATASKLQLKHSILNKSSIKGNNNTIDTDTGIGKGNNQTLADDAFSIDEKGKVASANQDLIKDKGDNSLYLKVYDLINDTTGTAQIPVEDKDLASNNKHNRHRRL